VDATLGSLMAAAQAGDGAAYAELLRELVPLLRAFVNRMLRDPDAAEDVLQQALLQLHRGRHSYRPERPFGAWVHAIARNAARDALRARKRRTAREVAPGPEVLEAAAAPPPEPEPSELGSELREALRNLPPAQRRAIELLYFEDLSIADAAVRAGATSGALKLRAHRALSALRTRFGRGEG